MPRRVSRGVRFYLNPFSVASMIAMRSIGARRSILSLRASFSSMVPMLSLIHICKKFDDGHKEFYFHYTDASGVTVNRKPDGCNNLYRLDDLAKANAAETLYIVEGEKCADAMARQGFLATSTNTGAQKDLKLSDMDRKAIDKFPDKVMIPDNDKPGDEYGKAWEALEMCIRDRRIDGHGSSRVVVSYPCHDGLE